MAIHTKRNRVYKLKRFINLEIKIDGMQNASVWYGSELLGGVKNAPISRTTAIGIDMDRMESAMQYAFPHDTDLTCDISELDELERVSDIANAIMAFKRQHGVLKLKSVILSRKQYSKLMWSESGHQNIFDASNRRFMGIPFKVVT